MAYKEPFRKLSLNEDLCRRLDELRVIERRQGSLTLFVSEILTWYAEGLLVRPERVEQPGALVTAAKLEHQGSIHHEQRAKTG